MQGPTDGMLLGQAIDGDRAAFLRLVDRYAPLVAALVQHRQGCEAKVTESVVAEVFAQAFLEIRRISNPEFFYRRLLQIAREKTGERVSASSRHERIGESENSPAIPIAQIVRWKYLEGAGYEEIGRRLGMPPQAIDQQIERGRVESRWSHWSAETSP